MMRKACVGSLAALAGCVVLSMLQLSGCTDESPKEPVPMTRLRTDRSYLRDDYGRYMYFQGVNTAGSSKVPLVDTASGKFTYIGRPFPTERARFEFNRMRKMGINSIRLLVMWEGVEPDAKGQYDEAYLQYLREIVKTAGDYGIYVLMDMHQDMFSRHLGVRYNEDPGKDVDDPAVQPGNLQYSLLSLIPPYGENAWVRGDGAPRWVLKACMPEKDFDSPNWGIPRIASGMDEHRGELITLYKRLSGDAGGTGEVPKWVQYLMDNLPPSFPPNQSTDMLPFTNWGLSAALSIDVERSYACLLAGDKAFPTLQADGMNIKDYLQEAYANAWAKVAEAVADLPNVMGYDVMNEPEGNFLVLAAEAAAIQANAWEGAKKFLEGQFADPTTGDMLFDIIMALRLLPPDNQPETLRLWGLDKVDLMGVLGLNYGFDKNHLTPFYDRVGQAILAVDPKAVIVIEPSMNITALLGSGIGGGMWDVSMTHPPNLPHVVYGPHNYADIYPFLGFNQQPRSFTPEEVRYRDYRPAITSSMNLAAHSLGNVPTIFGEFGTYFNFNGIEQSKADNYIVSSHILDNYYEAFDGMFQSRILWCHSPDNDWTYGDHWNHEDFSIIDPNGKPRSEMAWARPFVRALAGKPVSVHFWSDYHFFDPDKGKTIPRREFELKYASKESDAPTEIMVPDVQYPDGFYVWVSDGQCYYDSTARVLYHYPQSDDPDVVYTLRMLPPLPGEPNEGWKYFFKGDQVISR
ncbi:MAG: cellulase family glycosylhydrolase [Deltaproteobacteria bacterium]|nr:cellulase family glycosylhydrolase [Deltaproteobacteria bacterium]